MLKKIITLIFIYLLSLLLLKVVWDSYLLRWYSHKYFYYFIGSFSVSALFLIKYFKHGSFYGTLRHELCHWFFALISFNKPHALNINGDGSGSYSYSGRDNYCIALAPYFFPILSTFLLLVQLLFSSPTPVYYILMGFALAFDIIGMKNDYHPRQTDWHQYGVIFSFQFSVVAAFLFVISVLIVLFGGFGSYPIFINNTYHLFKNIIRLIA